MPWFGIDIGGTLVKLVYFEPSDQSDFSEGTLNGEKERVFSIRKYLTSETAYGETGVRDHFLELPGLTINGRRGSLHFIRFPTARMNAFIQLCKTRGFATLSSTVCATGGGAQKFGDTVREELDLSLYCFDELESVIEGIEFVVNNKQDECYFWERPLEPSSSTQVPLMSDSSVPLPYPYLVVNIGSGVSILAVYGDGNFKRVSGSSIGGGLFHGLCCLLTGCNSFEEAIDLATKGDNHKVDKLVKDIYGGDYQLFSLPGDTVACSFGHMIHADRRAAASKEDLARAALVTVTNNIGSIAINCAKTEKIDRILFVGNFLRVNPIASKRLAYAAEYWSQGSIKALFLRHEGYFGAVGCLLKLMTLSEQRRKEKSALAQQRHDTE